MHKNIAEYLSKMIIENKTKAKLFIDSNNFVKDAYIVAYCGKVKSDQELMINLLLEYQPKFLNFEKRWVDKILAKEQDLKTGNN